MHSAEHRTALLDWLGCAVGGRDHRAARAARMLGDGLFERIARLSARELGLPDSPPPPASRIREAD